jgi:hypothetical protein
MKRTLLAFTLAVAAASASASAQQTAPATAAPASSTASSSSASATITLAAPNNQAPPGTAVVAQQGSDVVVTVHAPQDSTTAAMIAGACTNGPKAQIAGPAQPLKPIVNHQSQTVIPNTTVSALTASPHAIIVQGGSAPLLCGNVATVPVPPANPPRP